MTLDRTGEPIEPVDDGQPIHDPRCDGTGWVDRDGEHPRPCLDCKPHLAPAKRRARWDHESTFSVTCLRTTCPSSITWPQWWRARR